MITKQSFIAILDAIRTQNEIDDKNGDVLTTLADPNDQFHKVIFTTPIIEKLISILADEMQSKDIPQIGNDIEYWIYEAEYGERFDTIWREDGSEVSIKTAGDLYDWLVECIQIVS